METIHKQTAKRSAKRKGYRNEPHGIDKALLQLGIKYAERTKEEREH